MRIRILFLFLLIHTLWVVADDNKLTGSVIGTTETVDYSTFGKSTSVNTRDKAFDGDLNTYFASWERNYTWTGLDLGAPHVITRVGWSPRNDVHGEDRVLLGVFEGANREDFMDALPLHIIKERGTIGEMSYASVDCSAGFRYVRYIGPSDARCNIAELEFYGHPGEGDQSHLSRLTNLPTVSIHTLNGAIPYDKEHDITAQISIIGDDGEGLLTEPGSIRERGNYSRSFPKKPYRIKFDKKQAVLGMPSNKHWCLMAHADDCLGFLKNYAGYQLSEALGLKWTPKAVPVELVMNGEYYGLYFLTEQVRVGSNRVNVTEQEDYATDSVSGGWLVEIDNYEEEGNVTLFEQNAQEVWFTMKSPELLSASQRTYIESQLHSLNEAIWGNTDYPLWEMMDLDEAVKFYLVQELMEDCDLQSIFQNSRFKPKK